MVCFSMFSVSAGCAFTSLISCMKPKILYDTAKHFKDYHIPLREHAHKQALDSLH